ncbi:MAG: hypothetical protein ACHQQQ_01340 [Bacteroidota bacterium]
MKKFFLLFVIILILDLSCKNNPTGPSLWGNLLPNPYFEMGGVPTLRGWKLSDSSIVGYSTDLPAGGAGHSIILHSQAPSPWPGNSIYVPLSWMNGRYIFRISVFGKKTGSGGGIYLYHHRPNGINSAPVCSLVITDSLWRYYSCLDTLRLLTNDTIFVTIHGGVTGARRGTTYFNTCKFEKLNFVGIF